MLILKWLHHLSTFGWSFSTLATMLRLNLFSYRVLSEWLNNPYETGPFVPDPGQLDLFDPAIGQPISVQKG